MAKYYAVKNGRRVGIFKSWEECREQVDGYSGAEYKGFKNEADARAYMGENEQLSLFDDEPMPENTAVAYTDGSYNIETTEFSYGAVIFANGAETQLSEKFCDSELASMRNVAGEIKGAEAVMRFCLNNGIKELDLYYDYEGVEKWCTGEWKTNKAGTIAYKRFYDSIKDKLNVTFNKVKSHSGDTYNDIADSLAKEVLGL